MDREAGTDDYGDTTASPMPDAVFLAMCDFLLAFKALVPDKAELRRGDLDALRQIVSLFVFATLLVIRSVVGWRERAAATALASVVWVHRSLRHPPQAWAAP